MLYETLMQGQILLWLLLSGFLCGFIFDLARFFHALCEYNKWIRHILDFFATLMASGVFFVVVLNVAFGVIRLWQILCFAASFALQRATVGRLLAKGFAVCYNSLSKKLKKDKE